MDKENAQVTKKAKTDEKTPTPNAHQKIGQRDDKWLRNIEEAGETFNALAEANITLMEI